MAGALHRAVSPRFAKLVEKFRGERYRNSYVRSHTKQFLARQMRAFRGDLSQAQFGEKLGVAQSVVSGRFEDPNYGKWNIQTLFEVAAKVRVAVLVRFVDFETFLRLSDDLSDSAIRPIPYDELGLAADRLAVGDAPEASAQREFSEYKNKNMLASIAGSTNEPKPVEEMMVRKMTQPRRT